MDLILDFNYFSFSNCNIYPNPNFWAGYARDSRAAVTQCLSHFWFTKRIYRISCFNS